MTWTLQAGVREILGEWMILSLQKLFCVKIKNDLLSDPHDIVDSAPEYGAIDHRV